MGIDWKYICKIKKNDRIRMPGSITTAEGFVHRRKDNF